MTLSGAPDPGGPPPAIPPYGRPPWPVQSARPATPGWVLPLLVSLALVTGLVGGVLGGALVLGTAGSGSGDSGLLPLVDEAAPLPEQGSLAAVARRVLPSTVQVRVVGGDDSTTSSATGSGFAVDDKGHVITNNHVVEVAGTDGTITVVDARGRVHRAELIGRSPVYDLAVLAVRPLRGLPPAVLGSSRRMRVGDTVVAIGSPLGLRSTVTSGIVSALDRPVTTGGAGGDSSFINAVQTDAAINPGNSGGPLVDLAGRVVGVNSAIATTGSTLGGQGGSIGVGFAIPMEQVRVTADQILRTGRAEYPVIGVNVDTNPSSRGAVITEVSAGTPAEEAGMQEGDRIVAVEGVPVTDGVALIVAIRSHRPGERVELTVVRDGSQRTLEVTLDAEVG